MFDNSFAAKTPPFIAHSCKYRLFTLSLFFWRKLWLVIYTQYNWYFL